MLDVVRHVRLDFCHQPYQPLVECVNCGNGMNWFVACHLYEYSVAEMVPEGWTATLCWKPMYGTVTEYSTLDDVPAYTIEGNVVTFQLSEELLKCREPVEVRIHLDSADGTKRLTTFPFWIATDNPPEIPYPYPPIANYLI